MLAGGCPPSATRTNLAFKRQTPHGLIAVTVAVLPLGQFRLLLGLASWLCDFDRCFSDSALTESTDELTGKPLAWLDSVS